MFSYLLLFSFLIFGCKGETGPEGPTGPKGDPGPGSRKVYSGVITDAARTNAGQFIDVPYLDLTDFPLVAVYARDNSGDWIQLNTILYDQNTGNFPIFEVAILRTGSVTLFSQVGIGYKIVIVY
jgi:hypothetical protein